MITSSLVFMSALWGLRSIESLGTESALIYASSAAMIVRIGYAYSHAVRKVKQGGQKMNIWDILPDKSTAVTAVVAGVILRVLHGSGRWKASWKGWMELVGLGGVLGLGTLAVM